MIKKHNPSVPVLIREAFGVPARVYARYGIVLFEMRTDLEYGVERNVGLDGLSEKQCEDAVERLVKQQEAVRQGSVS